MKSQIWRLAGVSVLSLAMFSHALADDGPDGRPGMGGGSPQRDQGRGNQSGGYQGGHQGGGNQGGGQQNPRPPQQQPPQQPQNQERQSNAGRAAQREREAAVQKQNDRREFVENYKGGPIPSSQTGGGQKPGNPGNGGGNNHGGNGWNNGHNNGGHNNGGYNNGGYGGGYNGGGYNGGHNDNDNHGRPGSGGQQWQGSGGKPPPGNQWNGGRPGGGWGSGPRWQPGYRVNNIPAGRWRVPHGGIDYYYADGYWYRPYGPSYIVVTPPYGVRVRTLPSYAEQLWIGSALYFIAAGTYYLYEADRQEYVVASPPVQVTSNNGWQGNGYDVVAYPANGQSQAQQAQDRYDCHRWAVNQSGFDPSQATYAPAANVADVYRRSLGACLAGRGYSVN